MDGESLWSRLAGLALIVEGCEYDRLHAMFAYAFERVTLNARRGGRSSEGGGWDEGNPICRWGLGFGNGERRAALTQG